MAIISQRNLISTLKVLLYERNFASLWSEISLLYNPTKITQSNRHLTTTQSCLQYPNQEWLLRYPKLGIHDSLLAM